MAFCCLFPTPRFYHIWYNRLQWNTCIKTCCTLQVRVVYRASDNNRSYSMLLSEARVAVEQESHDSVISIKLSELAMGIHGAVEDHMINIFKGVYTYTLYCKSFEVKKFHGFYGSIGIHKTFSVK